MLRNAKWHIQAIKDIQVEFIFAVVRNRRIYFDQFRGKYRFSWRKKGITAFYMSLEVGYHV